MYRPLDSARVRKQFRDDRPQVHAAHLGCPPYGNCVRNLDAWLQHRDWRMGGDHMGLRRHPDDPLSSGKVSGEGARAPLPGCRHCCPRAPRRWRRAAPPPPLALLAFVIGWGAAGCRRWSNCWARVLRPRELGGGGGGRPRGRATRVWGPPAMGWELSGPLVNASVCPGIGIGRPSERTDWPVASAARLGGVPEGDLYGPSIE